MRSRTAGLIVVVGVAALAAFGFALRARPDLPPSPSTDAPPRSVVFRVEGGTSAKAIAQQLDQAGLIRSPLFFRYLAAFYGIDDQLSAGEYEFSTDMTAIEILDRLYRGEVRSKHFTVVEGWRSEEIDQALVAALGLPAGAVLRAAEEVAQHPPIGLELPPGASLEGYLSPDTYYLPIDIGAEQVTELMLANFEVHFDQRMRAQAQERGLSLHQVVTLASIVEREAVRTEEMPLVAAVYLNRLRIGMKLDADPTVQYAVARAPASRAQYGYWKRELSAADLQVDSPYNTYLYAGLPPGPISSPGEAALRAVLDAEDTEYLYFVAGEDGRHVFARTLDEHLANVARYRAGSEVAR